MSLRPPVHSADPEEGSQYGHPETGRALSDWGMTVGSEFRHCHDYTLPREGVDRDCRSRCVRADHTISLCGQATLEIPVGRMSAGPTPQKDPPVPPTQQGQTPTQGQRL